MNSTKVGALNLRVELANRISLVLRLYTCIQYPQRKPLHFYPFLSCVYNILSCVYIKRFSVHHKPFNQVLRLSCITFIGILTLSGFAIIGFAFIVWIVIPRHFHAQIGENPGISYILLLIDIHINITTEYLN